MDFPTAPISQDRQGTWYDTNHDHKPDFALAHNDQGRVTDLVYDDDQDGSPDRTYPLASLNDKHVPHLIILLDSIPYDVLADRYARGDFRFFAPPVKVVPVFPTLTELCYSRLLGAPPLMGMTDQYYDPKLNKIHSGWWQRSTGWRQPWEKRLDYNASYFEASLTYLHPRDWLAIEMGRIRQALNNDSDKLTIVYTVTASGMASKYGREGVEQTLAAAQQLCLALLHERRGTIRISMMSDHGNNLVKSRSAAVALGRALSNAGFRSRKSIGRDDDVVIELAALVNYVGIHTRHAARVAQAAVRAHQVEFAIYLDQSSVIIKDAQGSAAIDHRDGAFRYRIIDHDVLDYAPVLDQLKKESKLSTDGWAADRDWFDATIDHRYPDAPKRLWEAFYNLVVSPPDVMITLKPGYHAGESSLEHWITMKSTHGSLDRANSLTFLLTMTDQDLPEALRGEDVMKLIEPNWQQH